MNFRKDRFVLWFNPDYYRAMYPDLKKFTNQQLKEHYINYGYYEDRIGSLRQVEYSLSHIDTHFYNEFYKEYEHLKNTRLIMPFPDTLSDDTLETKCHNKSCIF